MAERAEPDARAGLPAWSLPVGAVNGIAIRADCRALFEAQERTA